MSKNKDVKVEEVNDDEAPELLDNAEGSKIDSDALQRAQGLLQGKSSKRYAKAMQKLGLKPENGIFRVTIRKGVAQNLAISKTEVYRFPNTNTFVIFGEMSDDVLGGAIPGANAEAAKAAAAVTGSSGAKTESKPSAAADEDDENVDAGDLQEKEIKLVMSQANVSRGKAIKALKNNKGDIVNTIMELTM
jgi:nascent polypeptide-associated complex subunit alpha